MAGVERFELPTVGFGDLHPCNGDELYPSESKGKG